MVSSSVNPTSKRGRRWTRIQPLPSRPCLRHPVSQYPNSTRGGSWRRGNLWSTRIWDACCNCSSGTAHSTTWRVLSDHTLRIQVKGHIGRRYFTTRTSSYPHRNCTWAPYSTRVILLSISACKATRIRESRNGSFFIPSSRSRASPCCLSSSHRWYPRSASGPSRYSGCCG